MTGVLGIHAKKLYVRQVRFRLTTEASTTGIRAKYTNTRVLVQEPKQYVSSQLVKKSDSNVGGRDTFLNEYILCVLLVLNFKLV